MQPKPITSLTTIPEGVKVVLAPSWLVEKLNDNNVSLDVLSNGTLPDILSADDIIFYMAHIYGGTNNITDLKLILHNTTDHSAYPREWLPSLDAAFNVELAKVIKKFGDNDTALRRMAILGPEYCYDKSIGIYNAVELTTTTINNTMVVCYRPAKTSSTCNESVIKEILSFYGKFVPSEMLLQTSLYAYLLLGDAQYKRRY